MFEVRFRFDRLTKMVKFDTIEKARGFIDKIKITAKKNNKNGKLSLWDDGWLVESEEF